MKKLIILTTIGVIVWHLFEHFNTVIVGPGITVSEAPYQGSINPDGIIRIDGYKLTELASFDITAKVLGKENYFIDREADLAPTDLALGWGRMSDESILEQIDISQSGRFYYWHVESFPIPKKEIETHSANMHLIPADEVIKDAISQARKGDLVRFSGSLVIANSESDNWRWKSSLTRNDTGDGACEVVYVKSFEVVTEELTNNN